jgi:CMP/dCMP kinase
MLAEHEVRIVTVSREAGAGGASLATALGKSLGWPVVDRTLLEEAARRLQAPLEDVKGVEEHVGGLLETITRAFVRGGPDFAISSDAPDPETVARVQREVIRNVAESPPVIVVGRGAQCILRGRPDTLHVRLVAPIEIRAARLAETLGLSREQARERALHVDHERDRFIRHHFHCDRDNPHLYDLAISTGGISLDETVEIVLGILRWHRVPVR